MPYCVELFEVTTLGNCTYSHLFCPQITYLHCEMRSSCDSISEILMFIYSYTNSPENVAICGGKAGLKCIYMAEWNHFVVLVGLHPVYGLPLWYRLGGLFVKLQLYLVMNSVYIVLVHKSIRN